MVVGAAPAPLPPPPLGVAIVHGAIDEACRRATTTAAAAAAGSSSSSPRGGGGRAPVFRRAIQEDFDAGALLLGGSSKEREGLLFGVVSSYYSSNDQISILTTFYFAYSTWDGRVLYLDQDGAHLQDETSCASQSEEQQQQQHSLAVRRLLADIAVRCHCSRYAARTKQHVGYYARLAFKSTVLCLSCSSPCCFLFPSHRPLL